MGDESRLFKGLMTAFFLGASTLTGILGKSERDPMQSPLLGFNPLACVLYEPVDTLRVYTSEDIDRILHEVYTCQKDIPEYVTERFVRGLIKIESNDDPLAIGYRIRKNSETNSFVYFRDRHGRKTMTAKGLLQIIPATWKSIEDGFGSSLPYSEYVFHPRTHLEFGMLYFQILDEYFRENHPTWENLSSREKQQLTAAAWNFGPDRLNERGWNINRTYAETRQHVRRMSDYLLE